MFRLTSFLRRRPEFTHEAFLERWWREHSPLAETLPGLLKYCTTRPVDPSHEYDGVAELYFDDRDAFDRVLGPDATTDAIEDVPAFIESTSRYHLQETVHVDEVIDRPELEQGPVVEQTQFPVSTFGAFRRRDGTGVAAFETAIERAAEEARDSPAVRWFATATPTDDADIDVLVKRTADDPPAGDATPPAFEPLAAVAAPTLTFVGYERTVVDESRRTR